jgi:hypothetical protein
MQIMKDRLLIIPRVSSYASRVLMRLMHESVDHKEILEWKCIYR